MSETWSVLYPDVFAAFWVTLKLTVYSAIGALVWGVVLVSMRVSPVPVLRGFSRTYVEAVRNTPLTLLVLLCSIGLYQNLGLALAPDGESFIDTNNFRLAVLGFILYTSAFVAESLRSGINTVPLGQAEAARSLGMDFSTVLGTVVLPQAFRAVVRPLGSVLIALSKNTTVASVIGVAEASLLMKESIENNADLLFPIFGVFALGFVLLTLPTGLFFGWLDKKVAIRR